MKSRFIGATLCTALAFVLMPLAANAAQWQTRSVPFVLNRASVAPQDQDSVMVTRGAARTDTSAVFTVSRSLQNPTTADTNSVLVIRFGPVNAANDPNGIFIASGTTTITLQGSTDSGHSFVNINPTSFTMSAIGAGVYAHTAIVPIRFDAFRIIMNSAATGTQGLRISSWAP